MARWKLDRRPFDWLRRMWHGSYVKDKHSTQCPTCRGSDRSRILCEVPGYVTWECARCGGAYLS